MTSAQLHYDLRRAEIYRELNYYGVYRCPIRIVFVFKTLLSKKKREQCDTKLIMASRHLKMASEDVASFLNATPPLAKHREKTMAVARGRMTRSLMYITKKDNIRNELSIG